MFKAKVGTNGRIVIPAIERKSLNISMGDIIEVEIRKVK